MFCMLFCAAGFAAQCLWQQWGSAPLCPRCHWFGCSVEKIPWAKAPLFMFGLWLPGGRSPLQSLLCSLCCPRRIGCSVLAAPSVLTVSLSPVCSPLPAWSCLRRRQLEQSKGIATPFRAPGALAVLGGHSWHSCAAIPSSVRLSCLSWLLAFPWQSWGAGAVPSPAPQCRGCPPCHPPQFLQLFVHPDVRMWWSPEEQTRSWASMRSLFGKLDSSSCKCLILPFSSNSFNIKLFKKERSVAALKKKVLWFWRAESLF